MPYPVAPSAYPRYTPFMTEPMIDRSGQLLRAGGSFVLHADDGTRWRLELARVPVDLVEKRVRVIGMQSDHDLIVADGIQPA